MAENQQPALDNFYEASGVLKGVFLEEIKSKNVEEGAKWKIIDLKTNEDIKKVELSSDKALDLREIIVEINNKIEECTSSLIEKPILDKMKKSAEQTNTFKKPVFDEKAAINLGSFGKGKKRNHEQADEKDKDGDNPAKEKPNENVEDNKRQKVDESS
mmetsp:Transcript_24629/g.21852  ORF Transcript_24629/g.21852 Transcript_24629/m.21852 type:complete len:158 (+) Transcript_24629:191-664(+)